MEASQIIKHDDTTCNYFINNTTIDLNRYVREFEKNNFQWFAKIRTLGLGQSNKLMLKIPLFVEIVLIFPKQRFVMQQYAMTRIRHFKTVIFFIKSYQWKIILNVFHVPFMTFCLQDSLRRCSLAWACTLYKDRISSFRPSGALGWIFHEKVLKFYIK